MTTEEKLKHFLDTCMEDARTRSSRMRDEYTAALEKSFEEHTHDAKRRAQMQVRQETEKIERDLNKQLSVAQLEQKRILGQRQEELKEKLFAELEKRLEDYRSTPDYQSLLERQIQKAADFARGQELIVYLDPLDQGLRERLSSCYPQVRIQMSDYSFLGGTRAVIQGRNVLIDNSFLTRLAEARESFHFDLRMTPATNKASGSTAAGSSNSSEGRG